MTSRFAATTPRPAHLSEPSRQGSCRLITSIMDHAFFSFLHVSFRHRCTRRPGPVIRPFDSLLAHLCMAIHETHPRPPQRHNSCICIQYLPTCLPACLRGIMTHPPCTIACTRVLPALVQASTRARTYTVLFLSPAHECALSSPAATRFHRVRLRATPRLLDGLRLVLSRGGTRVASSASDARARPAALAFTVSAARSTFLMSSHARW